MLRVRVNRAWHDRDGRGSVFLFSKSANNLWMETQKLQPTVKATTSKYFWGNYGKAVSISDDLQFLAVSAPFEYDANGPRGVTYVYMRGSDGMYEEMQQLSTPEGEELSSVSGSSILFLNDFLLVGSGGSKTVYVFRQARSGTFQKTTELAASDASPDNRFGISIDGQGSDVMVRDCEDDTAYLYSLEDGVWKEKAKFQGCNAAINSRQLVTQSNQEFKSNEGNRYGGPVYFYNLDCESI